MDYVGKTITNPVWINVNKIYVASVDIPRGTWALILNLTPIENHELVLTDTYVIGSVTLWDQKSQDVLKCTTSRVIAGGRGWQLIVENNLPARSTTPVPFRYTINVAGPKQAGSSRKTPIHSYDPVVIAQPDPIYP